MENYINKFLVGNCLDFLKKMDKEFVDLTITSPPYDNLRDYKGFNMEVNLIIKELYRITKNGGVVVWVVGDSVQKGSKSLTSFKQALMFKEIGFDVYDVIIYEKSGTSPPHKNRYFNAFEYMFILSKGKPKTINLLKDKPNKWAGTSTFGNVTRREKDGTLTDKGKKTINDFGVRTNIWRYNNGKNFTTKDTLAYKHPAIFPEKLAEDHIKSWSNEGDLVLDIFGGSGTTAKMSILNKRDFIYIDISEEYANIAKERLSFIQDEFF